VQRQEIVKEAHELHEFSRILKRGSAENADFHGLIFFLTELSYGAQGWNGEGKERREEEKSALRRGEIS